LRNRTSWTDRPGPGALRHIRVYAGGSRSGTREVREDPLIDRPLNRPSGHANVGRILCQSSKAEGEKRSREALALVGLENRVAHFPSQLSGGQQQRVAIARALVNRPSILLADEPTGNLDSSTADAVFRQLLGLVRETGMTALVATHNPELAGRMDRTVTLKDGVLS